MGDNFIHLNVTQDVGNGVTIMFMCAIAIIAMVLLDLSTGIRAARATKEKIRSNILRRTVTKILDYYHFLLAGVVVDVTGLAFEFYTLPYCAILVAFAVAGIEIVSMYENFRKAKSAAADIPAMIDKIVRVKNSNDARELFEEIRKYGDKRQ
ncbi:MAG: phage holin family protein [Bacteroidaceae bacterium]|nr:phage holin family protein [Bacteroidaceae bacterium]